MPAPILPWTQSDMTAVPAPFNTSVEVLNGFKTMIDGLTHWSVEVDDRANGAIVIKPANGSAFPNQRMIVVIHNSQMATTAMSARYSGVSSSYRANRIWIGYTHDASGASGYTAGQWGVADPLGLGANAARWWKFVPCSDQLTTTNYNVSQMYSVENADGVAFFFNRNGTNTWYSGIFGMLMQDMEANVYGLAVNSGKVALSATYLSASNSFMNTGTSNLHPYMATWHGGAATEITMILTKAMGIPWLTTAAGTRVHLPIYYRLKQLPYNFVGRLRQIRFGQDAAARTRIEDSVGNTKSIYFAPSTTSADCISFDNG